MSGADEGAEPVADFRLRSAGPPVVRLSRRVLAGVAGVGAVAVAVALITALNRGSRGPAGAAELYSTDNKTTPDGLTALPRDYALVRDPPAAPGPPALLTGPLSGLPAPGDGARPPPPAGFADPEQQRLAHEDEAARTSRLFATTGVRERPLPSAPAAEKQPAAAPADAPLDPGAVVNMQDRKLAFVTAAVDRKTVTPGRLEEPPAGATVQAGSVIPAALVTGIRSDLPGPVTAQVTSDVFDSPTGRTLVIPHGSKLVGTYDSQVAFGQSRVLLVWTRLILPNGRSVVLEREQGADPQGFTGLQDEEDQHWGRLAIGAALSTLLGVGSELGATGNDNAIASALRQGSSNSLSQSGQQLVQRNMNVQPTLTIRPGFPVRLIVNRDLVLAPYRD